MADASRGGVGRRRRRIGAIVLGLLIIVLFFTSGPVVGTLYDVWDVRANAPEPAPRAGALQLTEVVGRGLRSPVHLTHAGDGSGRLFVVEQLGRIRIVREGALVEAPFLTLRDRVVSGGEMGLLSVAFHPDYAENGRLFVNYTRDDGRLETVVAEYRVSADDPDRADRASERVLLRIPQPYRNHNGGQLAFGPDGLLYVGMGDGGAANDPHGHGQDVTTLLGALLRVDVDAGGDAPYGIPPDNPFADGGEGRPELFAWGLRNPWRFSFDPATGRLFAADVGQNRYEEVHLVERGDDCGWDTMEGRHCFEPRRGCDRQGLDVPIAEYGHGEGQSITGGFVYRGPRVPALEGTYVFADYYPGPFWRLVEDDGGGWTREAIGRHEFLLSSFGRDEAGEVYVLDHGAGRVLRIDGFTAEAPDRDR